MKTNPNSQINEQFFWSIENIVMITINPIKMNHLWALDNVYVFGMSLN